MKKWLKWTVALVLCVLVLLPVLPAASGSGSVCFMAVNDTPLDLSASTMPTRSGGVLYVPYLMFSANYTGVNLGVYAAYNSGRGQVLVYSDSLQLVFDLSGNQTYDSNGNTYSERAMVRGSVAFLPIARVCDVFSNTIWYTVSNTQYGQLVRVKNSSAVLGDRAFIDAASSRLSSSLDQYLYGSSGSSSEPTPTPTPTPSSAPSSSTPKPTTTQAPKPATTPDAGNSPSAEPSASEEPSPSPSEDVNGNGAGVYLAFASSGNGGTTWSAGLDQVLAALSRRNIQGMFFFTADEITQQDDVIRRLVGSGHLVGVRVTSANVTDAQSELEEAQNRLSAVARCRASAVLADGLDQAGLNTLEQAGWVCWQTTLDGRNLSDALSENLPTWLANGGKVKNYLLLSVGVGGTLDAALVALQDTGFQLRTPVATEL